jgi:hypothetical protein
LPGRGFAVSSEAWRQTASTQSPLPPVGSVIEKIAAVTRATHGPNLHVGKVMSIFVRIDRVIGMDSESGLANLKTIAER